MEGNAIMTYIDNIDEVVFNIKKRMLKASEVSKLQRTIATFLRASNLDRVNQGFAVDGKQIGSYNRFNEIYVNPKNSPRGFTPLGKPLLASSKRAKGMTGKTSKIKLGKTDFVEVKRGTSRYITRTIYKGFEYGALFKRGGFEAHKTRWFLSYAAYRREIGRQSDHVNLQLSGKLFLDWTIEQSGKDWVVGFRSKYGSDVSRGNEKRFGTQIFGISANDYNQIYAIEKEFIQEALKLNA